jgi:hypothetical protein
MRRWPTMTDTVMSTTALPEVLFDLIKTEKVRIRENDGVIQLLPVKDNVSCTLGFRGMFAGDPNMTVDSYLQRKKLEKELDL